MCDPDAFILCTEECHRPNEHGGSHNLIDCAAWAFMREIDQNKISKAGYATPRGGKKGAYQNHVYRNNRVIIPYERLSYTDISVYEDGYIIRLFPHQYFESAGQIRAEFHDGASVRVGVNAFVLYRTHADLHKYPPIAGWRLRGLRKGRRAVTRRGKDVSDTGHYVLRIPTHGKDSKKVKGADQGIFAPEYSTGVVNYLSQCVLAWLIVRCYDSPYTTTQGRHLKAVLERNGIFDEARWEDQGILRHGATACPLCSRLIKYRDLHEMLSLEEEDALANAGVQIQGATRSTVINLFHLEPLVYGDVKHQPMAVAWGHAVCNTKLGQRKCYSLKELSEDGVKVAMLLDTGPESFGWISKNWEMIRSPGGSVWARLCGEEAEAPPLLCDLDPLNIETQPDEEDPA